MLNRDQTTFQLSTVYDLTQIYLDWCEQKRSRGTYLNQKRYLESLINSIGRRLKIAALKNHHITKWMEGFDSTSKDTDRQAGRRERNGAVVSQFAWCALDEGRNKKQIDPDQQESWFSSHRLRSTTFICHECVDSGG